MNILTLSPHTDDVELGAGGSVARWVEEGHNVVYWYFSDCDTEGIEQECYDALKVLGVTTIRKSDHKRRDFWINRQEICDEFYKARNDYDLVLCPSSKDFHQDHKVIFEEASRVFRCSILGYEHPWTNYTFEGRFFVPLKSKYVVKKISALNKYESQKKRRNRKYMSPYYTIGQARLRGVQANTEFAEAFEVVRWLDG
jgi:LmbE family N-acetylglucosaminyl deacetylase